LALLIWRESRIAGIVTIIASVCAGLAIEGLYQRIGYVRLLGLPHVLIWTPLVIYLFVQQGKPKMPIWPQRIIWVVIITILISLVFDYFDVLRYVLGSRASLVPAT
jgi:phosphoglycerol transferase MdoB-like AlkP superfamily enzyme